MRVERQLASGWIHCGWPNLSTCRHSFFLFNLFISDRYFRKLVAVSTCVGAPVGNVLVHTVVGAGKVSIECEPVAVFVGEAVDVKELI